MSKLFKKDSKPKSDWDVLPVVRLDTTNKCEQLFDTASNDNLRFTTATSATEHKSHLYGTPPVLQHHEWGLRDEAFLPIVVDNDNRILEIPWYILEGILFFDQQRECYERNAAELSAAAAQSSSPWWKKKKNEEVQRLEPLRININGTVFKWILMWLKTRKIPNLKGTRKDVAGVYCLIGDQAAEFGIEHLPELARNMASTC